MFNYSNFKDILKLAGKQEFPGAINNKPHTPTSGQTLFHVREFIARLHQFYHLLFLVVYVLQ